MGADRGRDAGDGAEHADRGDGAGLRDCGVPEFEPTRHFLWSDADSVDVVWNVDGEHHAVLRFDLRPGLVLRLEVRPKGEDARL
eukprot:SAG11_NODE_5216_length_1627_cov_6.053665_2_plen_84_part_00